MQIPKPGILKTVFVSGANGYLGSAISRALEKAGHRVIRGTRKPMHDQKNEIAENRIYGNLSVLNSWQPVLHGVEVVIHAASVVHRREPRSQAEKVQLTAINVTAVERLARDACDLGLSQVIFLSSIAVHGGTTDGTPLSETSLFAPSSAYAKTKLEAETLLQDYCRKYDTAWTIIRPSMVYGSNSPGNFAKLVKLVKMGLPLPFANVGNRRSLMFVDNLVDLIQACIENPAARNQHFVAADNSIVSTPQIVTWIAERLGRSARLVPFSNAILRTSGRLLGISSKVSSLIDDCEVDNAKAHRMLSWSPVIDTKTGIARSMREWTFPRHGIY